jgi:glycosyltransferase involved in cell wall biosynthesis
MLNGADAIATVSQTTKSLIEKARLTRKPVFVVYNAGAGKSQKTNRQPGKSLIYMGSFMDYKNVECLVDAMKVLPEFQLHLLSKISDSRRIELASRNEQAKDRIIFHNGVTDHEYHELLSQAFALVSASKDEGFGIPVIEAMEQGTPAIISDIEIFREIGGQAASYFDPTNPAELVARIRELEVTGEWKAKSLLSIQQSAKFNWEASAEALLKGLSDL